MSGIGPTGPQDELEWPRWPRVSSPVRSRLLTLAVVALLSAFAGALAWDALGFDLL